MPQDANAKKVAPLTGKEAVEDLVKKFPEVDPFLINKWERIFTLFFDRNCSTNLDRGDFYLVMKRVREVYGVESIQSNYARKTLEALWKGLCKAADSDGDNLITLTEWVELLQKARGQDKTPGWLDEYQKFMFKLFDVSGDGVLDQAEYADGMSLYGFRYKDCMNTFNLFAFDADHHPVEEITPAHWKELFMQLFFSNDRSMPGNYLFGKQINEA